MDIVLLMVIPMGGAILLLDTRMGIMVIVERGILHPIMILIDGLTEDIYHTRVIVPIFKRVTVMTSVSAMRGMMGEVPRIVIPRTCETTIHFTGKVVKPHQSGAMSLLRHPVIAVIKGWLSETAQTKRPVVATILNLPNQHRQSPAVSISLHPPLSCVPQQGRHRLLVPEPGCGHPRFPDPVVASHRLAENRPVAGTAISIALRDSC
jgi:hypothetical protein